jgi:uncharacterized protein
LAAEIRFEHEFTVEVPLEDAWRVLATPDALAATLPGSQLRAVDGVHTGRVELEGSTGVACVATITAVDQDDDEHIATLSVHGRQVEGPGIGSATLRSRLSESGPATQVRLVAEILTTGHEPGGGFEQGARRLFDVVAEGLERQARERPAPSREPVPRPRPGLAPAPQPPAGLVKPAGSWLERAGAQKRLIGGAAGLVIAAALLRRMRRRY